MKKLLQGATFSGIAGALLFLATLAFLASDAVEEPVQSHAPPEAPIWNAQNPEIDKLVSELRAERDSLDERRKTMEAVAEQLSAQRKEVNEAMARVQQLQAQIDKQIVQVSADELPNLKKQARIYASMEADSAAQILHEMEDNAIVKILASMKEDESALILESFLKLGQGSAKRAADISEQLRKYIAPKVTKK